MWLGHSKYKSKVSEESMEGQKKLCSKTLFIQYCLIWTMDENEKKKKTQSLGL